MSEDIWEQRYRAQKTGWDRGETSPALMHWLESGALQPGRILVPGCGHGHEVAELAARHFEVTALDIAETPVERLRKQLRESNLQAEVIQTDFLQWEAPATFDTIYEQTALCALEPETWERYADRLYQWLDTDGLLFALFMQTHREGGPPYHCDLPEMKALFPTDRWRWLELEPLNVPHPSGIHELGFVLKKT